MRDDLMRNDFLNYYAGCRFFVSRFALLLRLGRMLWCGVGYSEIELVQALFIRACSNFGTSR